MAFKLGLGALSDPAPGFLPFYAGVLISLLSVLSMYLGNAFLLILNLPLIPIWVRVLKVSYPVLFPMIALFCLVGAYSLRNSSYDILIMLFFGVMGYLMRKLDFEAAPLVMAFVLGPLMELNLRRSLILSDGSFQIFLSRSISAGFLLLAAIIILISLRPLIRLKRRKT